MQEGRSIKERPIYCPWVLVTAVECKRLILGFYFWRYAKDFLLS